MIKTIRLLLIVWLSTLPLVAQDTPDMTRIQGVVMDSITQQAVPFATVQLVDSVNQQRYGQITDDRGTFIVSVPQSTDYHLSVRSVGYQPHERTVRIKTNATIDLGEVLLHQSSTQLDGVTVSAAKSLVEVNLDRIGYRVKEDPSAQTSTLLEMLSSVPLVTVDGDDNVQVKGSSNFMIYMNGKPAPMVSNHPTEVLSSIPASSIQKVEVITDPGVKYDAEGVTAILNIVTEPAGLEGFTGSVGTRVSTRRSIGGNAYASAKKNKVGLTVNYNYRQRFPVENRSYSKRTMPSLVAVNEGLAGNNTSMHFGNALLSYEIDQQRLLNLTAGLMLRRSITQSSTVNKEWQNNLLTQTTHLIDRTQMQQGSWNVGVDYQKTFDRRGELLTASYQFLRSPHNSASATQRDVEREMDQVEHSEQQNQVRAGMDIHTSQIDYTTPIGEHHAIESGLKYVARRMLSNPTYQRLMPGATDWQPGSLFNAERGTDAFRHNQDILGAYAAYTFRSGAWALKTGGRVEYDWFKGWYPNQTQANFTHQALNAVPQLSVSYKLSEAMQLKSSYQLYISRPNIEQLNPFKQQYNEYSVTYGNPNLKSEQIHHTTLTFTRYSRRLTVNTSLAYDYAPNRILPYSEADATNPRLVYTTFDNIARMHGLSLNAYLMYTPFAWLRAYLNANVGWTDERAEALSLHTQHLRYFLNGGMQFNLPKDWNINVRGGYFNRGGSLQTTYSSNYRMSFGVNKSFLNKRLTVGVSVRDPFRAYRTYSTTTTGQGFTLYNEHRRTGRAIGVRISYRFGQMKAKVRRVQRGIDNTQPSVTTSRGDDDSE